jgi:three-Cys-motif partner protein
LGTKQECRWGTKSNENCVELGPDELPVQCVRPQAKDKHYYVRQYIEATHAVRRKYLAGRPGMAPGGAAYLDLFAGPGTSRIRTSGEIIEGTPLIAAHHVEAPFSRLIFSDLDPENVDALRKRTANHSSRTVVLEGDCNEIIDKIVALVPPFGLNFAFIDPFGLLSIDFETMVALARVPRMDMLIHFSTQGFKRNMHQGSAGSVRRAFGAREEGLVKPSDFPKAIADFREALVPWGYTGEQVRSVPIPNRSGTTLYHLVFVSKNTRGDKIWKSITRNTAKGQRGFNFE